MAKNKKYNKTMHRKIDSVSSSFTEEIWKGVKILIAIAIFLGVFYLLTIYILSKDDSTSSLIDTTPSEADIQYQKILAGNSFSMSDDHYFVLYYDMSDDDIKSLYTNIVSTYEDKDDHDAIYTVDMSSSFNKKYSSDTANEDVQSIDQLKISGPTLIEFEDGDVVDYIEGEKSIQEKLT